MAVAEAVAEAEVEYKLSFAKNLIAKSDYDDERIAKLTGLPTAEVQKLFAEAGKA